MRAIKALGCNAEFMGFGGDHLLAEGVNIWQNTQDLTCIGPADGIRRFPFFLRSLYFAYDMLKNERPDLSILIDAPAVNMRIGKFLRKHSLRSVYYFPPSAWTRSAKRLRDIFSRVDGVMCAFKRNAERYRELGLPVAFYGHPIVDVYAEDGVTAEQVRRELGVQGPVLAMLPGSRSQEVDCLMPCFIPIVDEFLRRHPDTEVLIPCATEALYRDIKRYVGDNRPRLRLFHGKTRSILKIARVALLASGSATLEATMCGVPMVICYRFNTLNALVGRFLLATGLVRVDHFGLPNLIADERIFPEMFQEEVRQDLILPYLEDYWAEGTKRQESLDALARIRSMLGEPGVLDKLARTVVAMAQGRPWLESIVGEG